MDIDRATGQDRTVVTPRHPHTWAVGFQQTCLGISAGEGKVLGFFPLKIGAGIIGYLLEGNEFQPLLHTAQLRT